MELYRHHLLPAAETLYAQLLNHFSAGRPLPFTSTITGLTEKNVGDAYQALFMDHTELDLFGMPPISSISFSLHNHAVCSIQAPDFVSDSLLEQRNCIEKINALRTEFAQIKPIRKRIIAICRYLHGLAVYKLEQTDNAYGLERSCDLLLRHHGICTAFARIARLLDPENIGCVTGSIRHAFSALTFAQDTKRDIPHMWNVIFENGTPIFFDPVSCVRQSTPQMNRELQTSHYRIDYSFAFTAPTFYNLTTIQRIYTIDPSSLEALFA